MSSQPPIRHRLKFLGAIIPIAALAGCSGVAPGPRAVSQSVIEVSGPCAMSAADEAWLADAIRAWNRTLSQTARSGFPKDMEAIIFDRACRYTSRTAMVGGLPAWSAEPHDGFVGLPSGDRILAQVVSFAAPGDSGPFFVMAAPSVWHSAGVAGGEVSLEHMTTAVLLHEAAHVLQFPTYGKGISRLADLHQLPEDFSDDSIQEKFASDSAFAASVEREIALLLAASQAPDSNEAARLVRQARALAKARHGNFFVGDLAYLAEAEDLWLSLEGSGQWLGYRWLADPGGGARPDELALRAFGFRGIWWSQKQGFASFAALNRLRPDAWQAQIFGDGARTIGDLLDEAATDQPHRDAEAIIE